jgi:glycosyltransferase involved in cell wall biosynthesis
MKIAVIAPPWIPIPPSKYGGIELVIYNLVEGLTAQGHEVILFAHRNSKVSCKLYPYLDKPRNFGLESPDAEKRHVAELASKYAYAMAGYENVDIIHDHTFGNTYVDIPVIHTLHGPANEPTVNRCVELSKNPLNHFVAISNKQRDNYLAIHESINFIDTVYNAINVEDIPWDEKKSDYCFFAGRANWEKGLDSAVRTAIKSKNDLVMAVKMSEKFEQDFFEKEVQPWINTYPQDRMFTMHIGLDKPTLFDLYKRAKCTLFTSQWDEPFGLVMIESMAAGTPVVALKRGSVPEVIVDGKTGYLVENEEEMIEATKRVSELNPQDCRKHVEQYFSRERMTQKYLDVYLDALVETNPIFQKDSSRLFECSAF